MTSSTRYRNSGVIGSSEAANVTVSKAVATANYVMTSVKIVNGNGFKSGTYSGNDYIYNLTL